jgi:RNA polymerase sigma factor (sigma-70 family)
MLEPSVLFDMPGALEDIDIGLVQLAANGDADAVSGIVRALERPVYGIAIRMLLDRSDAEDATQEALIRIVTRLAQFRGESSFKTWAYRIAVRRVLDFREQRAAAKRIQSEEFAKDLADGMDVASAERPEDAVLHYQLKLLCGRAMLHCLDGDHRIAFVLGEIVGLTSLEASEVLQLPAATFRKRLSRARAELAEFLGKHCGVFDANNTCRCHRRLDRALALGRVRPDALEPGALAGDLPVLRRHLATIGEMKRTTAFYREEPELVSKRDFVARVRELLGVV